MIIFQQISHLQMTKEDRRKQIEMWADLADLFELKKRCYIEAKQKEHEEKERGTFMTTTGGGTTETFTLH